jgi:hypothetical protein
VSDNQALHIGSHGFECDFSCGERWDDDLNNAADDSIGWIQAIFPPPTFGVRTEPYFLLAQPTLTTGRSRLMTIRDYTMKVTITDADAP